MPEPSHQQPKPTTRTLGVQRELSETLGRNKVLFDENSKYHVGMDLTILLDEVLNNMIRSLMIYDTFSGNFTDYELQCLCTVIKYNKSLIAINMNGVDIGDGAVGILCDNLISSNVQYMDFTNTPLDDDAGRSLLALVHNNHSLRTIIVDDTLISEEIMDDIDLACVFNEKTYDLPEVYRIDPARRRYCVQHLFGTCPNGIICPWSHDAVGSLEQDMTYVKDKPKKLELPPPPEAGASWRGADDEDDASAFKPQLGQLKKNLKKQQGLLEDAAAGRPQAVPWGVWVIERLPYISLAVCAAVVVGVLAMDSKKVR